MTTSDLGENTLGAILGRRREATSPRSPRRARALGATIGNGYLGIGLAVIAAIVCLHGLSLLVVNWNDYADPLPAILAWLVLGATLSGFTVWVALRGERLPGWLFGAMVSGVFITVALDLAAVFPLQDIAGHATAALCANAALLVVVTLRPAREIITATLAIAVVLIWAIVAGSPITTATLPGQLLFLAVAVAPPLVAVSIVHRFRRLVQTELDRVLVQSTTSSPRFAVGMLASEELARLDLAAEALLESVASERLPLPLDSRWASQAASLATELRLHLIEGRRETWLYHAITESETLGPAVTLVDRNGLAGLLDRNQRDGLLSALWLLVSTRENKPVTATVTVGPANVDTAPRDDGRLAVPITIEITGVQRNRIDPSVWNALGHVGHHHETTGDSGVSVEVDCLVQNPADH